MFDDFDDHFDHHHSAALAMGTGYGLYRHGQDAQTARILQALQTMPPATTQVDVRVRITDEDEGEAQPVNALDFATADVPDGWDDFIGQDGLKETLQVKIAAAKRRGKALDHVLLASGVPGIGKTTVGRLLAKSFPGSRIIELVPPFNLATLVASAEQLLDGDFLFIDEVHLLAAKPRGTEVLLKLAEDKVAYMPDGSVRPLNDITLVAATTEKGLLKEPVLERFPIKPVYVDYSIAELARIAAVFSVKNDAWEFVNPDLCVEIAYASRGAPRVVRDLVDDARDLGYAKGRPPTAQELLRYSKIEHDGLADGHIRFLTGLLRYGHRTNADGSVEYSAGEMTLINLLRETKQDVARIERYLIERGMVDRTPRGRRLTERGLTRARQLIAEGKGVRDAG